MITRMAENIFISIVRPQMDINSVSKNSLTESDKNVQTLRFSSSQILTR